MRGDALKHEMEIRAQAAQHFEIGFADKLVGKPLGILTTPSESDCALTGQSERGPAHDAVRTYPYDPKVGGQEAA